MPLIINEAASSALHRLAAKDPAIIVWWGTTVELMSGLSRLEREGVPAGFITDAAARLDSLSPEWLEVEPLDGVRRGARRLLRTHALRAGDALHLAAALLVAEGHTLLEFVCLDRRLCVAAEREGLRVVTDQLA